MASKLQPHIEEIRKSIESGETQLEVAKKFAVARRTVSDFCTKHGIKGPEKTYKYEQISSDVEEVSSEDILKSENRELRAAFNKKQKESVASARIIGAIEMALDGLTPRPGRFKPPPAKSGGKAHHRQMALLSDFHGGEYVEPEVVNYLNEYSWQIMEDRAQEVIDGLLSHRDRSPELTGLDIAFIGDMCSGANHDEITITNEFPLAEQAVKMGMLMGQIIEELIPHYPNINIIAVEGNHPRLTKAPAAKMPHNNGDWIAATFAKEYLKKYQTVDFKIGRGSILHQIAGRNIFCWHGDGIRSSMPGVPWGGVMRRVNNIQAAHRMHIDHFIYGHFHQANIVQAGRVIGNGSLKGTDEWVQKYFGGGDPPAQWLLTFDEKRERLTDARLITPTAGIPEL
jgi:predicted phosphodiesterase